MQIPAANQLPKGLWLALTSESDGDLPSLMLFNGAALPVLLKRAEALVADLQSAGFSEARIPLVAGWTLLNDDAEAKPEYAKAFSRHCMELASTGPNHLWFTISTGSELRTKAVTLDEFRGLCAAWERNQADLVEVESWHAASIEAMRDAEHEQGADE
ncbi:hypothetical protein ACRCRN_29160 [Pseudomonas aeruginosa]